MKSCFENDDDDDFAIYGSPLEPLDEGTFHTRKAPRLEDQIVTDERGRRRFHGAFTGGFSAGYFNSAGSKEGWTPSTFISSRSKRAEQKSSSLKPQDFMDDQDLRDQGIDPDGIRATSAFDSDKPKSKRKWEPESSGPIPGKPVLEVLLRPTKDTIGIQLLKKLGWRPGQGVGPRISKKEKMIAKIEKKKFYSYQKSKSKKPESESSESDSEYSKHDYAPDDIEPANLPTPKCDSFGLGYSPLERGNVLGFLNPSEVSHLRMKDKSKNISIRGHAFGVGAFEEDDADIYEKDDFSNYDFTLGGSEEVAYDRFKKNFTPVDNYEVDRLTDVIEGFVISSKPYEKPQATPLPLIPPDFKPIHQSRRRRFESKDCETRGLGRHVLTAADRQRVLAEPNKATIELRSGIKKDIPCIPIPKEVALTPEVPDNNECYEATKSSMGDKINFKPFATNPEKQKCYETYLSFRERGLKDTYHCIQSKTMTEWERNSEKNEFERAASFYAPLTATMSSRFTSASFHECLPELKDGLNDVSQHNLSSKPTFLNLLKTGEEVDDRMKAAKAKMFGSLTYSKVTWHPINVLCKRFNVPNPYPDSTIVGLPNAKKEKVSIFNFLSAPLNQTAGLQTAKEVSHHIASSSGNIAKNSISVSEEAYVPEVVEHNSLAISSSEFVEEENYGLKVTTTGPPTMNLFKAVFGDTDSDESDDESIPVKTTANPSTSTRLSIEGESSHFLDKSERNAEKNTTSDMVKDPRTPLSPSLKTNIEAKGVFKNIDFAALNEYRNLDCSNIESQTSIIKDKKENFDNKDKSNEGASGTEEDEYGPSLPPSLLSAKKSGDAPSYSSRLMDTLLAGSQPSSKSSARSILDLIGTHDDTLKKTKEKWVKKKSSIKRLKDKHKKKKRKKKKHKKEKKKKKKCDKRKNYSSSSSESSSTDN